MSAPIASAATRYLLPWWLQYVTARPLGRAKTTRARTLMPHASQVAWERSSSTIASLWKVHACQVLYAGRTSKVSCGLRGMAGKYDSPTMWRGGSKALCAHRGAGTGWLEDGQRTQVEAVLSNVEHEESRVGVAAADVSEP